MMTSLFFWLADHHPPVHLCFRHRCLQQRLYDVAWWLDGDRPGKMA
jgi:hypothetical protein